MRQDEYDRWYYALEKDARVYFKKLDHKFRPNNIVTRHVEELNSMMLLLDDEPTTVLYAGFRLHMDKFWDELDGCYLVEMRNSKRTNFVSDLSELGAHVNSRKPVITIAASTEVAGDIIVTPKRAQGNENKDGLAASS